ncbi:hypothetical protein ZIOFF_063642 [Zingiber officinale]|uniref:DNA polymerase V n=1 Tax=Zingiber officinale TaxID=94328 RepID=A0A8J5KGD9_ZINOF|nr:hypothetical protein ZIOFF_063642 [Zingiber officinale]
MGSSKKTAPTSADALDSENHVSVDEVSASEKENIDEGKTESLEDARSLKAMERRKKRKALDKGRHQLDEEKKKPRIDTPSEGAALADSQPAASLASSGHPGLHMNVFRDLASSDSLVREAAAESLVLELSEVQKAYEKKDKREDDGAIQLEAEKDDGLEDCAPALRYAIRRLIRGVSSTREYARQGFALGLTVVVRAIPAIKLSSVMKLTIDLLEVSSSMKGQEAKDNLLGRLFSYGSLARSGRIATDSSKNIDTSVIKEFITHVVSLYGKKRYLGEPAVSLICDVTDQLSSEVILNEVLKTTVLHDLFERAAEVGDPDALYLALKMQEKIQVDGEVFGKLLPCPFSAESFFSRDYLLYIANCFKESTFCLPRLHSLCPVVVNMLTSEITTHMEDDAVRSASGKKQKKIWKGCSSEDIAKNIRCFHEVVIEESLLQSSHDRKYLAFQILLLMLPKLPISCIKVVLSEKFVHCLMDILSNRDAWLYSVAQHFIKELIDLIGDDIDRRVSVIMSLQKHSSGKFDIITKTQLVKGLVAKFNTVPGCLQFVQSLMSLFVDDGTVTDEPSDQSHTTDENSDLGASEDKETSGSGNIDSLKNWIIDTMPRIQKNLNQNSDVKSVPHTEIVKHIEAKFQVQTGILKFLVVQGLFSASLGTEVTSFELQEKFKWPKASISSLLCSMCIKQLQSLLEDAQKRENQYASTGTKFDDLGSYFMCFLSTLHNIPSVSLYRILTNEDEKAFKRLLKMESKLSEEGKKIRPGPVANKFHAFRYLLIQLVLQVLLHPGEFSEAALEMIICFKKALPPAFADCDFSDEEYDGDDAPELMDVLVDTLLSLLPQSTGPLFFAVEQASSRTIILLIRMMCLLAEACLNEINTIFVFDMQVFKACCDDITDAGLVQMLRVVKKDLKHPRHPIVDSDDDDEEDDDFLGIEEADEINEVGTDDAVDSDSHADGSEELIRSLATDDNKNSDSSGMDIVEAINQLAKGDNDLSASGDSDDDMDDDAMFRMDSYITKIFKERKLSGSDSAQSQLIPFKLRVLSLLEIYLQKNPGKTQVLMVYSYLAKAYVNSHMADSSEQLKQRIGGILQKKIFKVKDYPKSGDIQLHTLETLLEKNLKSASRSHHKTISLFAQDSTFWLLKIIHARNFSESELNGVINIFQNALTDYLNCKKSRLKAGFIKEVIKRQSWLGLFVLGFLLEKCISTKMEFRRIEILDIIECIIKSCIIPSKGETNEVAASRSKLFKKCLSAACELIQVLLSNMPEKKSRRLVVRRFSTQFLHAVSVRKLNNVFLKVLKPDSHSVWESQLGESFLSIKYSREK